MMKNWFSVLASCWLSLGLALQASATDEALKDSTKIEIATTKGIWIWNSDVSVLRNGDALVSWVEGGVGNKFALKSRLVSTQNKLGKVTTLVSSNVSFSEDLSNLPRVVGNANGDFLASWVQAETINGVLYQKLVGRISRGGSTWSKAFAISMPLRANVERDCGFTPFGCGYDLLSSAVDGEGRFSVITGYSNAEEKPTYAVATSTRSGKWSTLKDIAELSQDNGYFKTFGLASGFIFGYEDYLGGESCKYLMNYYDPKTEAWGAALTVRNVPDNTRIQTAFAQRDENTVSVVSFAGDFDGKYGIAVRDFKLKTKNFGVYNQLVVPGKVDAVYQDFFVKSRAGKLAIGYIEADRIGFGWTYHARMATQDLVGGAFTDTELTTESDSADPSSVGITTYGKPFITYNQSLDRVQYLAMLGKSATKKVLHSNDDGGAIIDIWITGREKVFFTTNVNDDVHKVFLVKGRIK